MSVDGRTLTVFPLYHPPPILKQPGYSAMPNGFYTRAITVSSLLIYGGFLLGTVLIAAAQFTSWEQADQWGLAVLVPTATYSVHRSVATLDARLRCAFDLGREHERSQHLTSVR